MGEPSEPRRRTPRLAAGRARALGIPTRGTTNPNRLRRMDNWITATLGARLRAAPDPLVVDLGYGATPVTSVEFAARLRRVRPDVRVVGVEIDPERVAAAQHAADPPRLTFVHGGFEFGGLRPFLVRAANVLRQYDEQAGNRAWETMRAGLADGGVLVEGTCDEVGRRACWVLLEKAGPVSLTLACRTDDIDRPSDLAERLPKALIHRNVPGEAIPLPARSRRRLGRVVAAVGVRLAAAVVGRLPRGRVDLAGGRQPGTPRRADRPVVGDRPQLSPLTPCTRRCGGPPQRQVRGVSVRTWRRRAR